MGGQSKTLEIRTSWKVRTAGTLAGWIAWLWSWTLRIEVDDRCGFTRQGEINRPLIWCVWHNRIAAMLVGRVRTYPWVKGVALISASHDGAFLAAAMKVMGLGAVRGSASRRGSAALKELVRCVKNGLDVGVTPDGPRGPRYVLNPGLIKLAQLTRAPVMCYHIRFSRALRLKTWDRFVVPLPLSKITLIFDELLEVPRDLDEDGFEAKRREIEERMRQNVDDLDLPLMTILDGKKIAAEVLAECGKETAELKDRGIVPGLAVVLVGDDPASQVYVNSKVRTCGKLGVYSRKIELTADATQEEVLEVVRELNADDAIHGILVQSPPPPQIDEGEVINLIDPAKDVDGFHPVNVGKLVMEDPTGFVPCTPAGCLRLLKEGGIETSGADAVVIGRSLIVGKPMALLLMGKKANATVTVAHSRTRELADVCRRADIVVAAIGRPEFVTADFVKDGAVVIDVGINRVEDASRKKGYRLVGDVAYEEVARKCRAITPVPGGVGPMTIAMLISNTLKAARLRLEA